MRILCGLLEGNSGYALVKDGPNINGPRHTAMGRLHMNLCDGRIGGQYKVANIALPTNMEKRLEALGMTNGTSVTVLNSKSHGVLIVKVRGTRFALGRNITRNILVG